MKYVVKARKKDGKVQVVEEGFDTIIDAQDWIDAWKETFDKQGAELFVWKS